MKLRPGGPERLARSATGDAMWRSVAEDAKSSDPGDRSAWRVLLRYSAEVR